MERLSELLMDSQTAKLLDRSHNENNLTWNSLFLAVHGLILKVTIHCYQMQIESLISLVCHLTILGEFNISGVPSYHTGISNAALTAPNWVTSYTPTKIVLNVHSIFLFQEADRFRTEEQKAQSSSSSSQTNRDNIKIKCSALIDNIVTKAIKGMWSHYTICWMFSVQGVANKGTRLILQKTVCH
jgi:hypothetical protein